jgi:hypothetical protein
LDGLGRACRTGDGRTALRWARLRQLRLEVLIGAGSLTPRRPPTFIPVSRSGSVKILLKWALSREFDCDVNMSKTKYGGGRDSNRQSLSRTVGVWRDRNGGAPNGAIPLTASSGSDLPSSATLRGELTLAEIVVASYQRPSGRRRANAGCAKRSASNRERGAIRLDGSKEGMDRKLINSAGGATRACSFCSLPCPSVTRRPLSKISRWRPKKSSDPHRNPSTNHPPPTNDPQ